MLKQNSQYWICFSLLRLQMLMETNPSQDQLFTIYQIEIFYNDRFICCSKEFTSLINEHLHIPLFGNHLQFRFPSYSKKQSCQIHLVSIEEEAEKKIRGSYQFSLSNYVKAYQELHRNCMEMSVEISPNLMLIYEVFIEKTEEAINLIIQQHQRAKKFNFLQDNESQVDRFFSIDIDQEIKGQCISSNNSFAELDRSISPISGAKPQRKNKMHSRQLSSGEKNTNFCNEKLGSTLITEPSKKSFIKLSKTHSVFSEDAPSNSINYCANISNEIQELEIESRNDSEDQQDNYQELYQVLKKDSKIYIHKQKEPEGGEEQEQSEQNQEINKLISSDKRKKRSIKRYDNLLKHSFLAILIIVVSGFFIFFFFDQPTNSSRKKMKKIKKPKAN